MPCGVIKRLRCDSMANLSSPTSQNGLLIAAASVLGVLFAGLCVTVGVVGALRDRPVGFVESPAPSAATTPAGAGSPPDGALIPHARRLALVAPPRVVTTTVQPPPPPPPPPPIRTTSNNGGGRVYYANCAEARAAGAAPLHRGEPGYRSGLDRDG